MQRRTITIPLSDIRARAAHRPTGYFDDVTAAGTIEGDTLFLDYAKWQELAAKYAVPIPRHQWPTWAATIAKLKADNDTGLGDTIARVIGPVGGVAFKRYFKAIFGKSCGCDERQDALNRRYPYVDASPSMNG